MKRLLLVMLALLIATVWLSPPLSADTCASGEYKLDNLRDGWTGGNVVMWENTPGYECQDYPDDGQVTFTFKAGHYEGPPLEECHVWGYGDAGWWVGEDFQSDDCQEVSHVEIAWECDCATAVTLRDARTQTGHGYRVLAGLWFILAATVALGIRHVW